MWSFKGTDNQKKEVSLVFAESFFQWFSYFSKDVECLARGFEDIFIWEKFYFAVIDKKIAGMAAVSFRNEPCIRLNKSRLKKELGFLKSCRHFIFLKLPWKIINIPFLSLGKQVQSNMWLFHQVKEERVWPKDFWNILSALIWQTIIFWK